MCTNFYSHQLQYLFKTEEHVNNSCYCKYTVEIKGLAHWKNPVSIILLSW